MNLLSKSSFLSEDKLFATLETSARKIFLQDNQYCILSDTVGFIRKLPHGLVECFKSTLAEIKESDLLLHLVDFSHPNYKEQIKVVQNTLSEIGADKCRSILIFNKIDLVQAKKATLEEEKDLHEEAEALYGEAITGNPLVFISAINKENIDLLKEILQKEVSFLEKKYHFTTQPLLD